MSHRPTDPPPAVLRRRRATACALALAVMANPAAAAQPTPLTEGAPAPDFALPGVDGKTHRLGDFAEAKVLAVLFTCNHCPTAQAYEERVQRMVDDYKERGVALVAISPNDAKAVRLDELGYSDLGDSLEDMVLRARERKYTYPYLYDGEHQAAALAYGAIATPHIFIFDHGRKLRYQGRIDDSESGADIGSADARNAIDALLAGRPVPVARTRVFGCSTKWADKRGSLQKADEKWAAQPVALAEVDLDGVRALAANDTQKLRLINVWATWCGPCVAEFPDLVAINRMYRRRDFEAVTLSVDEPAQRDKVHAFLKSEHAAHQKNLILSEEAAKDKDALAEALDPKWSGPLPHTLLVKPGGEVLYRHTGEIDPLELRRAIVGYLGRTYH